MLAAPDGIQDPEAKLKLDALDNALREDGLGRRQLMTLGAGPAEMRDPPSPACWRLPFLENGFLAG